MRMSHIVDVNGSCHKCECVMSQIWMGHVIDMNESCHRGLWVLWQVWMSHVTRMDESCRRCGCVMPLMRMSHATNANESCRRFESVMSQMWISWVDIEQQMHIDFLASSILHCFRISQKSPLQFYHIHIGTDELSNKLTIQNFWIVKAFVTSRIVSKILKSQLATQFPIQKNCGADF